MTTNQVTLLAAAIALLGDGHTEQAIRNISDAITEDVESGCDSRDSAD